MIIQNLEEITIHDTIFILYNKSAEKDYEQDKIDVKDYEGNSYYFFNEVHFPLRIYDRDGFNKINYRNPIVMYKSKSFICKNIKKAIDVFTMKKFGRALYQNLYLKKPIIFIIDLDSKIKNRFKIVQVNLPEIIMN